MNTPLFYWLLDTLRALPLAIWIFLGLGVPYALLLLPRRDWRHRILVLALAFLCGASLLTAWMFILGTLADQQKQPLLRFDLIFFGTIVLGVLGWGGVWRKQRHTKPLIQDSIPFRNFDKLLIAGIVLSIATIWITTAFWTFTAYDTWWVYGFQGRLYTLTHTIPQNIGYYPQFISLQYAFYQLAFGQINDHYARVIVPFMTLGSIFSAYALGSRLFENKRIGLYTALLWALYPHMGEWAQMGDLEIPLTYTFTLTATFFLMAWHEPRPNYRRTYAVIAGLIFGVAMWTKPTAGAFVWGVLLLVIIEFLRVRGKWQLWLPRFEVAFLTGIACLPLGAIWYIRNIIYGHAPIDFPHESWLTLARRSGDLFGWLLLALAILLCFLFIHRRKKISNRFILFIVVGGLFILGGVLPSNPLFNPQRLNAPESYMTFLEWDLLIIGGAFVLIALWQYKRRYATSEIWTASGKIFHVLILALPYFITWFYAYSYHYRLSFAMVPLLILPSAVIISQFSPIFKTPTLKNIAYFLISVLMVLIALNPIMSATPNRNIDYLWNNEYPNDKSKHIMGNAPLVLLADKLVDYQQNTGKEPIVMAPGEQQLHFFFPLMSIINDTTPTQLSTLDGITHYLYGTLAMWRYRDENIASLNNQIVSSLARKDVMKPIFYNTDATFQYELYEINSRNAFTFEPLGRMYEKPVYFGDFAQLLGEDLSTTEFWGNNVYLNLLWQVTAPPSADYITFFELVDAQTQQPVYRWEEPLAVGEHGYYTTLVWEEGEYILDTRILTINLQRRSEVPIGKDYRLHLGMFRADDPTKTPIGITVDGTTQNYYPFKAIFRHGG